VRKILTKLVQTSVTRPKLTIALAALAVILCGLGLIDMKVDIDVTNDLPSSLPAKVFYDKVGKIFPSKDFCLLAIKTKDIFSIEVIKDVYEVSKDLEAVPGVYSVMSPTHLQIMEGQGDEILISKTIDDDHPLPTTAAEVEAFKARLLGSDMPLGNLVAKDNSALSIMVMLKEKSNAKTVLAGMEEIISRYRLRDKYEIAMAGKPVTSAYAGKQIASNMMLLFPLAILVIFALLFLTFRSLRSLFIPVSVVVGSSVIAVGLMTIFGKPFSMSTSIMPIIVASLSVASSIHIIRQYYYVLATKGLRDPKAIVLDVMSIVNIPMFYAAVTTMAGFLALTTSGIGSVSTLAVFTAVGILGGFLLSVTYIPALLSLMPVPETARIEASDGKLKRPFLALGRLVSGKPFASAGLVLACVALAAIAIPRINTDSNSINSFSPKDPIRLADTMINRDFAGSYPLTIVLQGEPGSMAEPSVLKAIEELEKHAATLPHVGGTQSLVSAVKRLNKVMHGGDEAYFRIPNETESETVDDFEGDRKIQVREDRKGRELVESFLSLVELQSPEALKNSITEDRSVSQMVIFLDTGSNKALRGIEASIQDFLKGRFASLPVKVEARATGLPILYLAINDMILHSQISSLIIAFALVFLLCALQFKSALAGLLCSVPLVGTVLLNFGIMGWFGITLDIQTMLISSIVIGVGVDYAIHFLYRTGVYSNEEKDLAATIVRTMESEGVSIFYNAAAVAVGFLVLTLSASSSIRSMGFLIAFNMFSSALIAILLLPYPIIGIKPKFLARVRAND
jgi:uncharacterized protein